MPGSQGMRFAAMTRGGEDGKGALLCMHQVPVGCDHERRTIAVRLADCEGQRNQASILVNRMYSWRGYGAAHQLSAADNCVTFTASSDDDMIGTLTLGVDSSRGLAADQTFKDELDAFRATPGVQLCELTKFAVDPTTKSKPALAALFHVIFIYGSERFNCTDLIIEVHPRHIRFYEVMLGFRRVGEPKIDNSVTWWPEDVPVQLMRLEVAEIRRQIEEHAGRSAKSGHSLYPFFFSPEEERGIAQRVSALARADAKVSTPAFPPLASTRRPQELESVAA